jgi:putative ABC transport system permease protein
MDSTMLDIRYAIRSLAKKPGFTLVALLTLALGIGATTAMFSVLDAALARSLPFPDPDRLVLGRSTFDGWVGSWVSFPDYMDYRDRSETMESLATIGAGVFLATITGEGEPEQTHLTHSTSNLFSTLGVVPHLGRFSVLDELPESGGGEVVISYTYWQKRFGGQRDVLGRSLIVEGDLFTVVGVLPAGFHFFYEADLWMPPWAGNSEPINRRYHNWFVIGRMAPGVTLDAARADIDLISAQLSSAYPESNRDKGLHLDGLHSALVEGFRPSLLLLSGAIVLVLFIACANVANLLLARGSTRGSELAVRNALGATRTQLTRQLLVECLVLALAAGCLGVVIAVWIQKFILGFVSMDRLGVVDSGISTTMLGIALVLSLFTVLIFGLFPSYAASRANPAEHLKTGSRRISSRSGVRFRSALVILQVGLSVILLAGSGLLLRSYAKLRGVDPGFRVENLLTATVALPSNDYQEESHKILFFQELQKRIEALPGVESVGLMDRLPILQTAGNVAIWDTENPPETLRDALSADRRIVLPGVFSTMEIPLLEGRTLQTSDGPGSQRVIVLNRSTAEAIFPDRSAIGHHVQVDLAFLEWNEPAIFEVVGVVEDYTLSSLGGSPRRAMFFPLSQQPTRVMRLAVATTVDPANLVRPIQESVWDLDRNIVLSNPQTMANVVSDSVAATRSIATVLVLFAIAALALAALGLHGVLAFFVSQRVHEIGIRVALGAGRAQVLQLVMARGMMLVAVGVLLGTVVSIGATRLVEGMLFQISKTDPVCFGGAAFLLTAIAVTACLLPAWRALRVNPLEALRVE